MNTQRLAVGITLINLVLFMFLLNEVRARDNPVLRGRELEIVDAQGRVRASIKVHPASPNSADVAILRLIDTQGRPGVKVSADDQGAGMALIGEASRSYVQLGTDGTTSSLRLLDQSGRERLLRP